MRHRLRERQRQREEEEEEEEVASVGYGGRRFFVLALLLAMALQLSQLPGWAAADLASETEALLKFYGSLQAGRAKERLTGWGSSSNGSSPCGWAGVRCRRSSGDGDGDGDGGASVVSVALPGRGLSGVIPAGSFAKLPSLQILSLRSNRLSGPIPSDILHSCPNLRKLVLNRNFFHGRFPLASSTIAATASSPASSASASSPLLAVLDLSFNLLDGPLPPSTFSALPRLKSLLLQNNSFSGPIPPPPSSSLSLAQLNVSFNRLSGPIPPPLAAAFPASSFAGNLRLCGPPLQGADAHCNSTSDVVPSTPSSAYPSSSSEASASNQQQQQQQRRGDSGGSRRRRLSKLAIALLASGAAATALLCCATAAYLMWAGRDEDDQQQKQKQKQKQKQEKAQQQKKGKWKGKPEKRRKKKGGGDEEEEEEDGEGEENSSSYYYGYSSAQEAAAAAGAEQQNKLVFLGGGGGGGGEGEEEEGMRFDLEDLLRASAEVLGKGTFGTSYKAVLEEGPTVVVKRLKEAAVGRREFEQHMDEMAMAGGGGGRSSSNKKKAAAESESESEGAAMEQKQQHKNLVPMRAYYYSKEEKLLVHDYLPLGSLAMAIHGRKARGEAALEWEARLRAAAGAAAGLEHIHAQGPRSVHGDVKPSNVLLHEEHGACVSDYGLAPLFFFGGGGAAAAAAARMPAGYRAPELSLGGACRWKLSQKADVYAFGVTLLEMLTGRPVDFPKWASSSAPASHPPPPPRPAPVDLDLPTWVRSVVREEWTSEVFDRDLLVAAAAGIEEEMVHLLQIALACSAPAPDQRPTMSEALRMILDVRPGSSAAAAARSAAATASTTTSSSSPDPAAPQFRVRVSPPPAPEPAELQRHSPHSTLPPPLLP